MSNNEPTPTAQELKEAFLKLHKAQHPAQMTKKRRFAPAPKTLCRDINRVNRARATEDE